MGGFEKCTRRCFCKVQYECTFGWLSDGWRWVVERWVVVGGFGKMPTSVPLEGHVRVWVVLRDKSWARVHLAIV